MKYLLSKIWILLILFSLGAELSIALFENGKAQYAMTDLKDSDKTEKEEIEKDKILSFSSVKPLSFKKEVKADFFIPFSSSAYTFLPEIPPKQA
jgi:hypothetical protein